MNTMTMKSALLSVAAVIAVAASAATTINVDSVVQRWPWNNKVDITYTVGDGQDCSSSKFRRIVFTTVIDGTTYTIDGVSDLGASANTGTHTVTWTLPAGVKSDGCTMSAAIYAAENPSGDDYMVIDLANGAVAYEGLLATQADSNARYNTATYKEDKLVLRKVPAGGPYPTGDSANYGSGSNANTDKSWNTTRDYYVGVFPVTQAQYMKLGLSNPSAKKTDTDGNVAKHRPVENVTWNDLRVAGTASTSSIPAVVSKTGTFFQRLNFITKNKFAFDLPTEVMFEIAERAGVDSCYFWGSTMDTRYVVSNEDSLTSDGSSLGKNTVAVGSKLPNGWGLFDTAGNVLEWCRDDKVDGDMASRIDVFTPAWASGANRRQRGGGSYQNESSLPGFYASYRSNNGDVTGKASTIGFRVAFIAD